MTEYIDTSAAISPCGIYRYSLRRRWALLGGSVLWILLNPSTASADVDDPTLRKGVGFSQRWEFASLTFANLFALRSTDARGLLMAPDPVGPLNDAYLGRMIQSHTTIICAWGAHYPEITKPRAARVAALLAKYGRTAQCLGLTKGGQPRHPLMLGYDTPREPFGLGPSC